MAINAEKAYQSRLSLPHKFVAINTAAAAAGTQIIGTPGVSKRIAIMGIRLVAAGGQTANLLSDTDTLMGALSLVAGVPLEWADPEFGVCSCDENKPLKLTTTAAVQLSGIITYVIEDL